MAKKGISAKNLGIILLIASILQFIPIPLIDERMIGTIIVFCVAIYLLIK